MRVLQLVDSLAAGGTERMAVNMANAFTGIGIANAICASRSGGPLQAFLHADVPVHVLQKKHALDAKAFKRFLNVLATFRPDVLHAHSSSFFWAVLARCFHPKLLVIWHDHYGLSETLTPRDRPVVRLFSRRFNGVIAVNGILKQWNIAHAGVPECRIRCLNNFPDFGSLQPCSQPSGEINIVCLANFKPEKDHPTLLRAFAKVVQQFPQYRVKLWLAGKPSGQAYDAHIHSLVDALQLRAQVVFAGEVRQTSALLSTAAIGVLSSYSEGLPLSLLEYGVAALPVVVTNVGQCGEVVQNGECGWLVPPRDDQKLADSLAYILQHPAEAQRRAHLLHQRVRSAYGAAQFTETYFSFINSLQQRQASRLAAVKAKRGPVKNTAVNL